MASLKFCPQSLGEMEFNHHKITTFGSHQLYEHCNMVQCYNYAVVIYDKFM
ncbi:hypothetical protein [Wolbachia endosymbiont (group A) of Volucella inflata]|uniref:hypothetical protein n=1 Tax=Wolbachia endosymbiont (group A) of Volucella inflata TaxID=2954065 RepID=UPI0022267319|nr:hypothetical protein [Wolbachia endosymbiont (group A) of Volucella inflata]